MGGKGWGRGQQKRSKSASKANDQGSGGDDSGKALLNNAVLKIMAACGDGTVKKGQILYSTMEVENNQKQTTVTISCLPNSLATTPIAGHVCDKERDAVNIAATVALEAIFSDKQLKELHDRKRPPRVAPISNEPCRLYAVGKCKSNRCKFLHVTGQ